MNDQQHTVLCVDDEQNILSSLRRLLRKEDYRLLIASSGSEGIEILKENHVHVVMSDQRMPGMTGTEFFARVKEEYPDIIRIILTGYTEVDSITESINRGHIYKFFLKPWNDQNLKLEIKQALEQYDLIRANKKLHETIMKQNEELKTINENLEWLVRERTMDLEIQNKALELSRAILEDLPIPIVGVSAEGMIAMTNRKSQDLLGKSEGIELGRNLGDCFSGEMEKDMMNVLTSGTARILRGYGVSGITYDVHLIPLSGRFSGKGVVLTMNQPGE